MTRRGQGEHDKGPMEQLKPPSRGNPGRRQRAKDRGGQAKEWPQPPREGAGSHLPRTRSGLGTVVKPGLTRHVRPGLGNRRRAYVSGPSWRGQACGLRKRTAACAVGRSDSSLPELSLPHRERQRAARGHWHRPPTCRARGTRRPSPGTLLGDAHHLAVVVTPCDIEGCIYP